MSDGSQQLVRLLALPILCAVLAIGVRLPSPPQPEAAAPWVRGALALQGLRESGDSSEPRRDLAVALPLSVGQNIGYLAAKLNGGSQTPPRVAWIRGHETYARSLLWSFWITAAVAAALLALRVRPGGWGLLAGIAIAVVPIGIAGTNHSDSAASETGSGKT